MNHLCDSNVFIALTLEAHPHQKRAVEWLEKLPEGERLYFCRATQISYLRLLTVREWMKEQVCTNAEAINSYQVLRSDPRIGFVSEEPAQLEKQWLDFGRVAQSSPKRWMDAYLAAFALCAKMSFVTFDRGFNAFSNVELIILNG